MSAHRTVSLVTLGCGRNEVDSEELAARLEGDGWSLVEDAREAAVVVVNTCGFVETAKRESVDTLLDASDMDGNSRRKVVAVGCMAERYAGELADALPEADAVLGFDDYVQIGQRLDDVVAGKPPAPRAPRDRRRLLPVTPVDRGRADVHVPGHGQGAAAPSPRILPPDLPERIAPPSGPRPLRRRLAGGPVAPLKLASGCDRRCTFCAIPSFRGAFISRSPDELLAEAEWLVGQRVREIVLVSENSTSYGKDLGDVRLLERLLPELTNVPGLVRVRVSYLQPAEMRPSLVEVMTSTPGVAPYFDLSFQHASAPVLRRMRRFGDRERFLELLAAVRDHDPEAGARTNVIVGFPGESPADVKELERFLVAARFDAVGVFGYSDEDGTAAARLDHKVSPPTILRRVDRVRLLVEELIAQRAEERLGSCVEVLVEEDLGEGRYEGRAAHQAPEVDGSTTVRGDDLAVGDLVRAKVTDTIGVDLVADAVEIVSSA